VLNANFTASGTYSVRLIAANGCGPDTIYKTICVSDPPVPSFTSTPHIFCAPLNVVFTNTSTGLGGCSPTVFQWQVSKFTSTCLPDSTSDYVYTGGTSSTSTTPAIRFNNQGSHRVRLQATNACPALY